MEGIKRRKEPKGKQRIISHDVTMEILSWLPAKSLVRFRRVCKLWLSITHNPHFIDTHLRNLSARAPTLLMIPPYLYYDIPNQSSIDKINIIRLDCCDNDLLIPKPLVRKSRIFAACNGLLCLSEYDELFQITRVVNPATGESLTLPQTAEHVIRPYFGFEPTKMEYKVIRTFYYDNEHTHISQVYTLGIDSSWRTIHSSIHFSAFYETGVAVNGSIHWQTWRCQGDLALRFDLKDECFHHITLPDFENFYGDKFFCIGREFAGLQGSLCLPFFPNVAPASGIIPRMDIWVMTSSSSRVKDDWSMKYSVRFPWGDPHFQLIPLSTHNHKILVKEGTRLRYHDLHPDHSNGGNNTYQEVYQEEYRIAFVTTESLVPLPN